MFHVMKQFNVLERRICRVLNQPRSTQRYLPRIRDAGELLTVNKIELATKYGQYGYRRIATLLQREGFNESGYGLTWFLYLFKASVQGSCVWKY